MIMRPLLIACGNPLRGDDGVAASAAALLAVTAPDARISVVRQLTPELAAALPGSSPVVFIDAAVDIREIRLEILTAATGHLLLSHHVHPAAIVNLARDLFDFRGAAFLCRIPASDLRAGVSLSVRARHQARRAAAAVEVLLRGSAGGAASRVQEYASCER